MVKRRILIVCFILAGLLAAGYQLPHRRLHFRGGAWTPPQSAYLVGAWVEGISGAVSKLGTWQSAYGVPANMTLAADAEVTVAGGLVLDGTGDTAISAIAEQTNTPYTLSMWIVLPNTYGMVFSHGTYGQFCMINTASPTILYTVEGYTVLSQFRPTTGVWAHLVIACDGAQAYDLYWNGSNIGTTGSGRLFTTPASTTFRFINHNVVVKADCIYYYRDAKLSEPEIIDLYTNDPHKRPVGE